VQVCIYSLKFDSISATIGDNDILSKVLGLCPPRRTVLD